MATNVTATLAPTSAVTRTRVATLSTGAGSPATLTKAGAPRRPWVSRSAARERPIRESAASEAAATPAIKVRRTATKAKLNMVLPASTQAGSGLAPGGQECQQQLALQGEHLLLVLGLGMIETQQVQDAVGGQEQQFLLEAVPGGPGLDLRHLGTEHDI